jgi:diadenosine tetraphosphate (Ap4A) HIT family hydrolase
MTVKDILGNEWDCKCIGCSIGKGEMIPPGNTIMSTENFVLHQDPEIPIKGFLIAASKKHIKSISELRYEESQELFDLIYRARIALNTIEGIKDVTIVQEERSSHLHFWLLPRYDWMYEKFGNSISTVRDILSYAKNKYKTTENIADIILAVDKIRDTLRYNE